MVASMIGRVKELDPSVRYDLQMRADRMAAGKSVCHGDFNPTNVIAGDDGELYVCDWAHVTQGLPEADAAMTYILFNVEYPEKCRGLPRPLLQEGRRPQAEDPLLGSRRGRRRALPQPQGERGVPRRAGSTSPTTTSRSSTKGQSLCQLEGDSGATSSKYPEIS